MGCLCPTHGTGSTNCTAYILLPHSLHSYTSIESYAAGIPFVVPSPTLLADWHIQHRLIWHRCPNNTPTCGSKRGGGPDSYKSPQELAGWLSHAEFYHWPHVATFNREHDLPRVRGQHILQWGKLASHSSCALRCTGDACDAARPAARAMGPHAQSDLQRSATSAERVLGHSPARAKGRQTSSTRQSSQGEQRPQ